MLFHDLSMQGKRHPRQDTDTRPHSYLRAHVSISTLLPSTSLEPNHHLAILAPPTVPDRFASLKCHSALIYRVVSAGKARCTSDLKGNELTRLTGWGVGSRAQTRKGAVTIQNKK